MKLNPKKYVFEVECRKFLGFIVNHRGIEANPAKINSLKELCSPQTIKEVQGLIRRVAALNQSVSRSSDTCKEFFNAIKKCQNFKWIAECEEAFQS